MDSKLPEGGSLPVAVEVPDDCLIDLLRKDRSAKGRTALQLFFWENFNFPADIDKLQFASAAEKYILKEMLWIMFLPFSYSDKLERTTGLITAASRCAETFDIHPEYNEEEVQQIIRDAGYRSSTGLDDFMARQHRVFQHLEQFTPRNDLKDVLIGYLAE